MTQAVQTPEPKAPDRLTRQLLGIMPWAREELSKPHGVLVMTGDGRFLAFHGELGAVVSRTAEALYDLANATVQNLPGAAPPDNKEAYAILSDAHDAVNDTLGAGDLLAYDGVPNDNDNDND